MKKIILTASSILISFNIYGQEALKSTEEEYYDFLSVEGITERPTINYRSLSDSQWNINNENHPWNENNLGSKYTLYESTDETENKFLRGIDRSVKLKVYGPEWFNSYNTATPYGQNDGALWQGKGYNTSLTAGARLEAYGLELTFKPKISWMQNREFEYATPAYGVENYKDKANLFGYYGITSIDAPQRFGDKSFYNFDFGDTEIRYTWNCLTAGFGTQSIWLGPAQLNPIMHSNNAPGYPKFDIGLRRTGISMPYFGWNLGEIEARGWWGKLSESEYFDNLKENDNNLITGISLAYAFPGVLEGLSIGVNRTMLSKWDDKNTYSLFEVFVPGLGRSGGKDENDQRFSMTFDYNLKSVGFDIYLEWARNDYTPTMKRILRYPFHTEGWTFGARKNLDLPLGFKGQLKLEITHLESSRDYELLWATTFYAHHIISQGYTNKGQWLGAGIGTGGNSQYLGLDIYGSRSKTNIFIQRINPDLDYTWFIDKYKDAREAELNIRANIDFGISSTQFVNSDLSITAAYVFDYQFNHTNCTKNENDNLINHSISFSMKYNF